MSGNLVELARRFVRLSGELDATRGAMKRLLMNGAGGPKRKPYSRQAARRERAATEPPEGAPGARGRRGDPQAPEVVAGAGDGSDRQVDRRREVDDGRAVEAPSGEGRDRARRLRRRVASASLTAEEIADLLAPCPAVSHEPWIKPLASANCEATSSTRFG